MEAESNIMLLFFIIIIKNLSKSAMPVPLCWKKIRLWAIKNARYHGDYDQSLNPVWQFSWALFFLVFWRKDDDSLIGWSALCFFFFFF